MKIEVYSWPIPHLIFYNLFKDKQNKEVLKEALSLKSKFKTATIGRGLDKTFRSNIVCYYDEVFDGKRNKSKLLTYLDDVFNTPRFREILSSFYYPMTEFMSTTTHESQVSRYGSKQKYDWHIDRFASNTRMISLIYYFYMEPKKWKGGQLEITDSPIYDGKTIDKNPTIKIIEPKNNMAIVFGSSIPHRVRPTSSSKSFIRGRFSVNCWIGKK